MPDNNITTSVAINGGKQAEVNNDITDFLLAEYENVAKAFFNTYELGAKWIRYYMLIAAVPFAFITVVYREKGGFNLFDIKEDTIAVAFLIVGMLNVFVSYIIIDLRLDSVLYARTVNGVRKYFVANEFTGQENFEKKQEDFLRKYVVLPIDINKPLFFKRGGDLSVLVLIMGIVNSFYISVGFLQVGAISNFVSLYFTYFTRCLIIFLLVFILHFVFYNVAARNKENSYCKKS